MSDKQIELNLNEIFNEEVINNMQQAGLLAINYAKKTGKDIEKTITDVISYNIAKALEDGIENSLVKNLPKQVNWENENLIEVFDEFKTILDIFYISKLKKYKFKMKINSDDKTKENILAWRNIAIKDYQELKLDIIPLKIKNTYRIELAKV